MKIKINVVLILIAILAVQVNSFCKNCKRKGREEAVGSFFNTVLKPYESAFKILATVASVGAFLYSLIKGKGKFIIENQSGKEITLKCASDNEDLEVKEIPHGDVFTKKFHYYFKAPHYQCTVTYLGYTRTWSVFGGNVPKTSSDWQIREQGIYLDHSKSFTWNDEL
jgi:hypothetical protein